MSVALLAAACLAGWLAVAAFSVLADHGEGVLARRAAGSYRAFRFEEALRDRTKSLRLFADVLLHEILPDGRRRWRAEPRKEQP